MFKKKKKNVLFIASRYFLEYFQARKIYLSKIKLPTKKVILMILHSIIICIWKKGVVRHTSYLPSEIRINSVHNIYDFLLLITIPNTSHKFTIIVRTTWHVEIY